MAEAKKTAAPRTEVTLKEVHTHGGKQGKPGDKITVTDSQKAWLTARKII